MKTVFITGVSSGLGHSLAREYLSRGWRVFGVSRRTPTDLAENTSFAHAALDLSEHARTGTVVPELLGGLGQLDLAVLNAGVLGCFDDMANVDLDDLKHVLEINVWANKTVLDTLFSSGMRVGQVVAISSGASVNGNRGWAGYAMSKTALNMLTKLYSREHPETHFCAIAPGLIETDLLDAALTQYEDDRFPSLDSIRRKRNTGEVMSPEHAASALADKVARLPELVESGEYADIRRLE